MLLPHLHATKHEQPAVNRTPDISIRSIQKKGHLGKREEEVGFNV